MFNFTLPDDIPQENFKYENGIWYARTVYGNTYCNGSPNDVIGGLNKADIILVSLTKNEFIPVSVYDEHQNGLPIIDFYKKERNNFFPVILHGIQHPIDYVEAKKLENCLIRLHNSGLDISDMSVFMAYLFAPNTETISALDYINHTYDIKLAEEKLSDYGLKIFDALIQIRDCRNTGVYHGRQLKKAFLKFCQLLSPYDLVLVSDIDDIKDITASYIYGDINQDELEYKLFGYYGVKNKIHNRIREVLNDKWFKDLVGNPKTINNYMEIM